MTDRDRYELKIAGLLHDCGKVTTPVHVVDKATKLQTIYDRISLIDTRFEVVQARRGDRAAQGKQLAALQRGQANGEFKRELAARSKEIEDDREFLRRANTGGEGMKEEDVARVNFPSFYQWVAVGRGGFAVWLRSDGYTLSRPCLKERPRATASRRGRLATWAPPWAEPRPTSTS